MKSRFVRWVLGFFFLLLLVVLLGPRVKIDTTLHTKPLPKDLEAYLKKQKARFPDITPNTEKKIVWWNSQSKQQTALSVVYLHGFSATRQEIDPFCTLLAKKLKANVFYTRLRGHGRSSNAMAEASVNDWLNDGAEALEIARRLGKHVIVVSSSTGATLALWLAAQKRYQNLLALITFAPNFFPKDSRAGILLWPWGKWIGRLVTGKYRSWKPHNKEQGKYWTTRYPSSVLVTMMGLVELIAKTDLAEVKAPVLMVYSPKDRVINTQAIEERFPSLGSVNRKLLRFSKSQDPSQHILAGRILSPRTTKPLLLEVLQFLKPLLPKNPR